MGELQINIICFLRLQNNLMDMVSFHDIIMLSAKQICRSEIELVLKLMKVIFKIRFDAAAEQMRGTVLDSSFMGGECTLQRHKRNYYRIPANIERYEIKVGKISFLSVSACSTLLVRWNKKIYIQILSKEHRDAQ